MPPKMAAEEVEDAKEGKAPAQESENQNGGDAVEAPASETNAEVPSAPIHLAGGAPAPVVLAGEPAGPEVNLEIEESKEKKKGKKAAKAKRDAGRVRMSDERHPLNAELRAIPLGGDGTLLTPRQLLLLCHRDMDPSERRARASAYFATNGLIFSKWRPGRPPPKIIKSTGMWTPNNDRFDNITEEQFADMGMTRADLDFASGGTTKKNEEKRVSKERAEADGGGDGDEGEGDEGGEGRKTRKRKRDDVNVEDAEQSAGQEDAVMGGMDIEVDRRGPAASDEEFEFSESGSEFDPGDAVDSDEDAQYTQAQLTQHHLNDAAATTANKKMKTSVPANSKGNQAMQPPPSSSSSRVIKVVWNHQQDCLDIKEMFRRFPVPNLFQNNIPLSCSMSLSLTDPLTFLDLAEKLQHTVMVTQHLEQWPRRHTMYPHAIVLMYWEEGKTNENPVKLRVLPAAIDDSFAQSVEIMKRLPVENFEVCVTFQYVGAIAEALLKKRGGGSA